MHLGIDYGSKLAGTTAICYQEGKQLIIKQSEKKKDADQFILDMVEELSPNQIFIDAPLSLPAAYFGIGEDFFYRSSDRALKAMSPMFLGGLTARAMSLKRKLLSRGVDCHEVYPGGLIRDLDNLKKDYTKKSMVNTAFMKALSKLIGMEIEGVGSWHQIDAALCWFSGKRYLNDEAKIYGDKDEGLIFI